MVGIHPVVSHSTVKLSGHVDALKGRVRNKRSGGKKPGVEWIFVHV